MARRIIHEHSFVNASLYEHLRTVVREGGGRGVAPFYERPFVNEVELHKQMNPHEHTQYKECETIQSMGDPMQSSFDHILIPENVQFVSGDNLSHRFLRQHDVVSYKIDRPKGVRKKRLS